MLDLRIKELFFDRPKVKRAVDAARRKVLSKGGAFIRQTARTSIRKRKGTSKPGSPPYSHVGLLRRFILFGYDRQSESVVIGPVGIKGSTAPRVLEQGGKTTATRRRRGKRTERRVRVAARPYMNPALEKERPKLPELWRNSVKGV